MYPASGQGQARGKALSLKRTLLERAVKNNGVAWVTETDIHLPVRGSVAGWWPTMHLNV